MLYFIDYDLRKKRNYQPLYDELKRFGAIPMLESWWCFRSNSTAVAIRDHFAQFIDTDDGLSVSQVADWATRGITNTPNKLASAA